MKYKKGFILFLLCTVSCFAQHPTKYYWETRRGVNSGTNLTKSDIADLKSWKVNLLRISLTRLPVVEMKPPYRMNPNAFAYIDNVLDWCEESGISVIIDPHKYPGMGDEWTMLRNDSIWQDFKYHDIIARVWDTISNRYKNRGRVIAAYDILNEPETSPILQVGSPGDINLLYEKVIKVIRKNDPRHTISLALPRYTEAGKSYGYHKGITMIKLPKDDNIILESHTYMPEQFTHQGIMDEEESVHYPGIIDGKQWDLKALKEEHSELISYSKKHKNIPILIGEFGCPRWTGEDGVRYLGDVIKIAEENNWSWAYHSFRESPFWDAELSQTDRNDLKKDLSNSRLKLLKDSFEKNKIQDTRGKTQEPSLKNK